MKQYHSIIALFLLLTGLTAQASGWEGKTGWVQIYQHDFQGYRVTGDMASLVNAIQHGADVKVSYQDIDTNLTIIFNCEWTMVKAGFASCVNTHAVVGDYYESDDKYFGNTDKAFHAMIRVNTDGEWDMSRWSGEGQYQRRHIKERHMLSWWVRTQ